MPVERSLLFVPGDRPERFAKALATAADRVVIDLEDAVLPEAKVAARSNLNRWPAGQDAREIAVRINSAETPWFDEDLGAVAQNRCVRSVIVPKADSRVELEAIAARLAPDQQLIALIETLRGYLDLRQIATARGLTRIAFGSVDFCTEAGICGFGPELDSVRIELVIVSRAAGLAPPIEGVTLAVKDVRLLEEDVDRARRFGFGGKLCIHPCQVETVNGAFSPSAAELDWARRVLEGGTKDGAFTVDGNLVDRPIVERARRLIKQRNRSDGVG